MKYDDLAAFNVPTIDQQTRACMNLWAEVFRVGLLDMALRFRADGEVPFWIKDTVCRPGSFVWLCDLFNLDPDNTRSRWRANLRPLMRSTKNDAAFEAEVRHVLDKVASPDAVETRSSHSPVLGSIPRRRTNRQPQRASQGDGA